MIELIAILIAILALCTSVLILIVQYRNQVEHRHGEIAKLRSDFMQKLSTIHHRMMSVQMHLETARLELRRMRECDDKYNSIERMPRLVQRAQETVRRLAEIQSKLERLDTTKANKPSVLMTLQSTEHDFQALEDMVSESEQEALKTLTFIRSEQEEADRQ